MGGNLFKLVVGAAESGGRDDLKWNGHSRRVNSSPDYLALRGSLEFSEERSQLPSANTLSETLSSCLLKSCRKMKYLLPSMCRLYGM